MFEVRTLSLGCAISTQETVTDWSICVPSAWQAGDGADSQCGGLALQSSPGALGQTGSNRGRNKTLPMAANVT